MKSRALLAGLAFLVIAAQTAGVARMAGAAPTEQKYGYSPESFEIKFYLQPRQPLPSGDNGDENGPHPRRGSLGPRLLSPGAQVSAVPTVSGRTEDAVKADYPASRSRWVASKSRSAIRNS
jgi:hypothetical protein